MSLSTKEKELEDLERTLVVLKSRLKEIDDELSFNKRLAAYKKRALTNIDDTYRKIMEKDDHSYTNIRTGQAKFSPMAQSFQEKFGAKEEETPKKKLRRFPSGAVRSDDTGRPRPDYISPYAIIALGEHFGGTNENDFGATNYYKGIKPVDCLGSMLRHYCELAMAIHENDQDAIRSALKSYTANGIMALHQVEIERKGLYTEIYEKTEII